MLKDGAEAAPGLDRKQPWLAPVLRSEDIRRVTGDFSGTYFDGGAKGQNTPAMRPR